MTDYTKTASIYSVILTFLCIHIRICISKKVTMPQALLNRLSLSPFCDIHQKQDNKKHKSLKTKIFIYGTKCIIIPKSDMYIKIC